MSHLFGLVSALCLGASLAAFLADNTNKMLLLIGAAVVMAIWEIKSIIIERSE